jgi:3-(3-hydroxy-phenyl)propionate hydroxylase
VLTLGDTQGRIKEWFGQQDRSIAFLRPDRFVAALASPQEVTQVSAALARLLHAPLAQPALADAGA